MVDPPGTLNIFRNIVVPAGPNSVSNTQEPSVDANGRFTFQVGNWYATKSVNNGVTWQYLDPTTAFGSGFCCDQVALYDPARNVQFWLLQYSEPSPGAGNFLKLAVSAGNDLTSWCSYTFTPASFGEPANAFVDYNDMALSNNFLWIASNVFPTAGGDHSAILRLSLDGLAACGGVSTGNFTQSEYFTFKPVQGATDTMYWGSNKPNSGVGLGSAFRVYMWPDNSNTITWFNRTVAPFVYFTRDSGQNCGSTSGNVKNWCEFSDSRTLGGFLAKGVIGFSFSAKQDGSHPFPFTRLVRFVESTKNYINYIDYWSSSYAVQFMTWAPNDRGHLGATFAWGGGTTADYYPGTGMLAADDFGNTYKFIGSNSNAGTAGCQGVLYRWGDFLTIRPYHPADLVWIGAGMRNINGGPCVAGGYSEVRNFIFGRVRDVNSYLRWKNS